MMKNDQLITRRDFLRSLGRYLVFGLLVAGTGALVARHDREQCVNQGICRGCSAFTDCGLPQALSAKLARGEAQR